MVKRVIVGAHYGLKDWLVQRVTAVLMALYTLVVLVIAVRTGGFDHASLSALFGHAAFRLATLLFVLALLWHAWVGMRDIWMDYVKPTAWRLALETLTAVALIGYAAWTADILWGRG